LERSAAAVAEDPKPEEVFEVMGLTLSDAEVDEVFADSPAVANLRRARTALSAGDFVHPLAREALNAGAHIASIIVNDGVQLGFEPDAIRKARDHYSAFRVLTGSELPSTRGDVTVPDYHPTISIQALSVTPDTLEDIRSLFDALLEGVSRVMSVDARGEMSYEAMRLFEDLMLDASPYEVEWLAAQSFDAKFVLSRLQSYDIFYLSREQLEPLPMRQIHMVAVGSDEIRGGDDDSVTSSAVESGGHSIYALRGAQIPPGFKSYARTIARAGGGDETILELYAAKSVPRDFMLYAAFGHPRTLAEVTAEQMNIPPTLNNRIARFCRRVDAIIRVGRDPTVLVRFDWNIPAEVLRTIVEERVRLGRPLTVQDLLFIEDAHIMV
jgi:hypothetical protein